MLPIENRRCLIFIIYGLDIAEFVYNVEGVNIIYAKWTVDTVL